MGNTIGNSTTKYTPLPANHNTSGVTAAEVQLLLENNSELEALASKMLEERRLLGLTNLLGGAPVSVDPDAYGMEQMASLNRQAAGNFCIFTHFGSSHISITVSP